MSVRIFTTGGTIDKVYFDAKSEFEVGEPLIGTILREAQVCLPFAVTPLMRKDSLEIDDNDRGLIVDAVNSAVENHFVITHGTDTMSLTAQALIAGGVVQREKTVVLTGALNPAKFHSTDAIFNVGMAIAAAQTCQPGVYIAMNGQIFHGDRVHKNVAANRFEALPE